MAKIISRIILFSILLISLLHSYNCSRKYIYWEHYNWKMPFIIVSGKDKKINIHCIWQWNEYITRSEKLKFTLKQTKWILLLHKYTNKIEKTILRKKINLQKMRWKICNLNISKRKLYQNNKFISNNIHCKGRKVGKYV